jgi:hypothetical protein
MKPTYFLLYFILFPPFVFAQNFEYAAIKVTSLSFAGNSLKIKKDDGSGSYTTPNWTTTLPNKSPVAYVSGDAPSVSASFTFACANAPSTVNIRGEASDSITFPSQKVTLTSTSGNVYKFDYPETVGSHVFKKGEVRFFKPFIINWQVSFDNGANWGNIGETKTTLYVLYTAPQAEKGDFQWFHTVYDLSCRNAQYKTNEKDIIAGIWTEFTDHIVLNYNNDSLFYYKTRAPQNVTLGQLLKYRDAQCYTFAQLFLAAIKIQGIVRTNNYIQIWPTGSACGIKINGFLVKNFGFLQKLSNPPCADFPYGVSGVKNMPGLPGSCTTQPTGNFSDHQVTKIDGIYYDPSYGTTYNSLKELKDSSLDGWTMLNGAWYYSSNVSLGDLKEVITTY